MANVSLIQQTSNQLHNLKNVLSKAKFDAFDSKIHSAVRKPTLLKIQAKLSKIEHDNNELVVFKQELLQTLKKSIDKKQYAKLTGNINRSKNYENIGKVL